MKLIRIDKDCHGTIVIAWVILACLIACVLYFSHSLWVQIPLIAIFLLNAVFVFWFHRVPERTAPEGDDRTVTSVADGKVIIVEKVYEKEYFKEERIQVSVYMNFFDVHANFWPMDGQISYYKYHPGKYLLAFLPIDLVKKTGCKDIRLMCLVAAPEGVRKVQETHPDVDIYVAAVDRELNSNCYILPGLGDAGDRIFGTI